jgi:putative copper export protein
VASRGFVRLPGMRFGRISRRLLPLLLALLALLALAPAAMAADGVGTYGRTDDKVVTFFAFGVIAFFAILVTVLSLIQIRLENRKERRTEDLERLGSR